MNLESFTGPGSTPSRRRFWDKITKAVIASQKVAGRNVSVDEHWGSGTVINVIRERGEPPPTGVGACCQFDGSCDDVEEFLCVDPAIFLGVGTTCATSRCEGACATCDTCNSSCVCDDTLTYDECQALIPPLGGAGWLLGGNCIDNDCAYFGCTYDLSVGACCAGGFCLDDIDEETCAGFGGTFWQGGISCTNAIACGYTDCGT